MKVNLTMMVLTVAGLNCGLLPVSKNHLVQFSYLSGDGESYSLDPVDSAAVFRTEGLVIKVSYRSKQELQAEYPDAHEGRVNLNPFTFGTKMNNDLGYVPDRFTVFELDVNNIGRPLVQLQVENAELITDRGDRLRPWGIQKGEGTDTFEEYYRARRGPGGNDQQWYRERMAIVERSLYRGESPLFKGQRKGGKLVFTLVDEQVRSVRLRLDDVAIDFDEHGLPTKKIDLEFRFQISVDVEPVS